MKLKSIELQGFKSFVEKTRLEFDEGITAILGPNGCGKSNVVDAVRWVLGSQSAKQLRGGSMDDVIFKGTTKRRPVGMAEVTLVFSNEDRGLPIDFSEVAVRRRINRDGTSNYYLNGTVCRLKDLRDLFYDSGVNNTSYSIIEESMIKQILNENNQELRILLEEGSGITKYKARRKEAQRKLDRTQSDLLRLYDIIEEIGREVRSLKRQVGKARRYQKLFKEIRALDLLLAGRMYKDLEGQDSADREKLGELRAVLETDVGELSELRARIETARPEIDEREAERRQLEEALQAFEEELQESERQVLLLEHRSAENERRTEQNSQTVAEIKRRRVEIDGQVARLQENLVSTAEELEQAQQMLDQRQQQLASVDEQVNSDRGALETAIQHNLEFIENDADRRSELRELKVKQENRQERLDVLAETERQLQQQQREHAAALVDLERQRTQRLEERRQLLKGLSDLERRRDDSGSAAESLQQEIAELTARREALKSRHELLEKIKNEYQGYGQGAQRVLQRHGDDARVVGGLADCLQVDEQYTAAFETLLGQVLDAVVVEGTKTAMDLVAELRQGKLGQASFLCGGGDMTAAATALPADGTPAFEVASVKGAEIPYLQRLLAATAIFDSDEAALAAASAHRETNPIFCLSRSGLLVSSDGVVRGGEGQQAEVSMLGRGEKLQQLADEITGQNERLAGIEQKLEASRVARRELVAQLQDGREQLTQIDELLGQLQVNLAQHTDRQQTAERRQVEMTDEQSRLGEELAELVAAENEQLSRLDESGKQRDASTVKRDELRQIVESAELNRDECRAEVEELRLIQQRREGQRRETDAALAHLRDTLADLASRQERLVQDIDLAREEQQNLSQEHETRKEQLAGSFAERERRRQIVRAAADSIQGLHEQTAQWHDRVKHIEDGRAACREKIHEIETGLATLEIRRNNLTDRIEEQYKGRFTDLLANLPPEEIPRELERDEDVFQPEQAAELLENKRNKFGALGPINHLALEEYETKKERLDFLEAQRDDVEKAKDDLVAAIARINRTAKKLFMSTFEEVRRNYIAVFQTLFEGGRADLQLIRTDDPLESDIHVIAQPRGKVVDHVSLLSGGERCLTALSILFAVYLVKPSPFCLLDEADAPLDDSNIRRFVRMLREFSKNTQFLVITHNKLTMETANHLYGVTMMEQGCSSIVSVSFHDVSETQSDEELAAAIQNRRQRLDQRVKVRELLADDETDAGVRFTMGGVRDETAVKEAADVGMRFSLDDADDGPDAADDQGGRDDQRAAPTTVEDAAAAEEPVVADAQPEPNTDDEPTDRLEAQN